MWEDPSAALVLASAVSRVAAEIRFDLLHAHFAVPYAVAADLATILRATPIPRVVTLHGTDVTGLAGTPEYRPWIERAVLHAAVVTVPSRALAAEVSRQFPSCQPEVVANFVDADRFRPGADRTPPNDKTPLRLVHASNFRPLKRVEDVVEIFARVNAALPARLSLLGDGPRYQQVVEEVRARGFGDSVDAPGSSDAVERWLGQAHIALVPSSQESFGLFALEALACGTPVVASRVGGLPEVVTHQKNGFLETVADVATMARRVIELARNPEQWLTFSLHARTAAIAAFSPERALAAYERCYARATASQPYLAT
jgi:N-acetyl-alpha-D-glucosaminyl L-malate synthase BshA